MNLLRFSMMVMIATRMGLALATTEMAPLPAGAASKEIEQSSTQATKKGGESFQEALGGIVINQTMTVTGQEFFKQFYALWNDKPLLDFFAITVRERPSARRGNRIVIEYAQRTLFETSLPSSRAGIQSISERAVQISYDSMVDTAVQRLLFREQDLAADEF